MKLKRYNEQDKFDDFDVEEHEPRDYENINLRIGERVQMPNVPIDKYQLVVRNMHGDADQYTTEVRNYSKKDIKLLKFTLFLFKNLEGIYCDDYDGVIQEHNELFDELDGHDLTDYLYDLMDRDVTSDGQYWCSIDGYRLYYYDNDGIKYNVIF